MTGQELATAVQYGAPIIVLVIDNGMLGTIRMHQERHYPGRVSATDLVNPDFAALGHGVRRPWRAGRAHGGLRVGVRAGARRGRSGRAPCRRRSRGDHAEADDRPDPRGCNRPLTLGRGLAVAPRSASDRFALRHHGRRALGVPTSSRRTGGAHAWPSYASTVIDAPADNVWERIRDFNGLGRTRHSGLVARQ